MTVPFFFFNDTATTEIYTLSLHDALPISGSGSLLGSSAPAPAAVNLTSEGTADWVHWGLLSASYLDRKASVSPQISTYRLAAAGVAQRYNQVLTSFNWTDGTPDASSGGTRTRVSTAGTGNGFTLSA